MPKGEDIPSGPKSWIHLSWSTKEQANIPVFPVKELFGRLFSKLLGPLEHSPNSSRLGHSLDALAAVLKPFSEDLAAGVPDCAIFSRTPTIGSSQSLGEGGGGGRCWKHSTT